MCSESLKPQHLYRHGFARVAAASFPVSAAHPLKNAEQIKEIVFKLAKQGVAVVSFPELCISGYALDDLLLSKSLLDAVEEALAWLCEATIELPTVMIVGAPLVIEGTVYNCAVFIGEGKVLAITPKTYLPNYHEFYEKRYFGSGSQVQLVAAWDAAVPGANEAPVGYGVLRFSRLPELAIAAEVCEDMWVPLPPSVELAMNGANVIFNLSASPATVGRARRRKLMVESLSARNICAYVYTASGAGESSTDLAWDGQAMIYENGELLAETERFTGQPQVCVADINLAELGSARRINGSFRDCAARDTEHYFWNASTDLDVSATAPIDLLNPPARFPFVPSTADMLDQDCYETYQIQVYGLRQRIAAIGSPKLVIGVSGGLDSTHALLVAAQAMDSLGRSRSDILAYTMPGFATSDKTKNNAYRLCESLGIQCEEIDIRPAAAQMLKDMGHPFASGEKVYDVTFENVQAGLRTDYLFRLANQRDGIVVGTGDLSELALGWCTYGVGDQMSHYAVNCGVPKTLIQHVIRWVISEDLFGDDCSQVLDEILHTEISPELVPAGDDQQIQSTEGLIGPYELHDFFLYYLLRGYRAADIAYLATQSWCRGVDGSWPAGFTPEDRHQYSPTVVCDWLETFIKRFFSAQFKRTAIPNGPKVLAGGAMSPRGDWRMPSDISAKIWLDELAQYRLENGF